MPRVDLSAAPKLFAALHRAIVSGRVRSCHDLSEGGLAVAAAEMAFAGELGVDLQLYPILAALSGQQLQDQHAVALFSESNTRFLVEVPEKDSAEFESLFAGLPCWRLGRVTDDGRVKLRGRGGVLLVDADGAELKQAWQRTLAWD